MAAFSKRLTYAGKVYSFFGAFPSRAHAKGEGEQLEQGVGAKVVILSRGGQFGVYALIPRKNPRQENILYLSKEITGTPGHPWVGYTYENGRKVTVAVFRSANEAREWSKGMGFKVAPLVSKNPISAKKARTILHHGKVRGKKLTEAQRKFMGARASGYPVRKNPDGKLVLSVPGIGDFVHDHRKAMKGIKKNPPLMVIGNPPRWKYEDARGIIRTGTFHRAIEGQGTDVTYIFIRDDGTTDVVSGSSLKKAHRIWEKNNPPLMVIGNPPLRRGDVVEFRMTNLPGNPWKEYHVLKHSRKEIVFSSLPPQSLQYQAEHVSYTPQEFSQLISEGSVKILKNNPPGDLMSDSVHEVRYTHRGDGQPYKHSFKRGVRMLANEDGTITMYHPTKRIHEEFPE